MKKPEKTRGYVNKCYQVWKRVHMFSHGSAKLHVQYLRIDLTKSTQTRHTYSLDFILDSKTLILTQSTLWGRAI